MPINKSLFVLGIASTLIGCALPDPFAEWTDAALADRARAEHAGLVSSATASVRSDELPATDLPANADADWFVALVLTRNADIRRARQEVERRQKRIAQARGLPDPMVTVTAGELAQTAAGAVDYVIGLQQMLPYPGTLDARAKVARQETAEALEALADTVLRVEGDTRRVFWSYHRAFRESQVLKQSRTLLEQIQSAVRARLRVDTAGQDDLLRVNRRIAILDNRLSTLAQRKATSVAMLNRLMSRRSSSSLPTPASMEPTHDLPAREVLIHAAMQSNSRVRIALAEAETWHSRLSLAQKERLPDFQVGAQYGAVRASGLAPTANGDDQFAVTIGATIPLWSEKYNAAEREAALGIGKAIANLQAARDAAAYDIDDGLARVEASTAVLNRLRKRMMPDARQTIKVALMSYQTGKLDLLQLLEDWDALLDDQLTEAQVIAELGRALADIEQALGQRPAADGP